METIGEICTRDVVVVRKDASIREAAGLMRQFHVGDVVVVEEQSAGNVPVGILTDRDIVVEILAENVDFDAVAIADVMSFELFTVEEHAGVCETIEGMRTRRVRRCPVVDSAGVLVGVVAADDLLEYLVEKLGDLARIGELQQKREGRTRSQS